MLDSHGLTNSCTSRGPIDKAGRVKKFVESWNKKNVFPFLILIFRLNSNITADTVAHQRTHITIHISSYFGESNLSNVIVFYCTAIQGH